MSSEVKSWMNILNWSSRRHYMTLTHTATQVLFFIRKIFPSNFWIVQLPNCLVRFPQNMGTLLASSTFLRNLRTSKTQHSGSEASRNKNVLQIDLRSSIGLKNCFWWRFPACQGVRFGKSWRVFLFLSKQPTTLIGGRKVTMVMHLTGMILQVEGSIYGHKGIFLKISIHLHQVWSLQNGKSPFRIGNTSSNGGVFGRV